DTSPRSKRDPCSGRTSPRQRKHPLSSPRGELHFTEHLRLEGISPSVGSVGDAYDNALMETINGLYKSECIRTNVFHEGSWKTIAEVEYATASWVEWYNNRRLHSSLGMISPTEFEAAHYADTEPQAD
ncbi:transposase, partial [Streptomyces sp. NPDC058417]|uniref:transposase n=1 Tax=unclassified Streptomyces TaxID=2593676 RepID=UPI003662B2F4